MSVLCADDAAATRTLLRPRLSWSKPRTRAIFLQLMVVAVACAIMTMVAIQTASNLRQRGIASGFDFLSRATGFEISFARWNWVFSIRSG